MKFFTNVADILTKYWVYLLEGLGQTMLIALTGTVIGLIIGLLTGIIRTVITSARIIDNVFFITDPLFFCYCSIKKKNNLLSFATDYTRKRLIT